MNPFRSALATAILAVAAPLLLMGCDNTAITTVPSNPPPIPTDAKGKPVPPPTAAGGAPAATKTSQRTPGPKR